MVDTTTLQYCQLIMSPGQRGYMHDLLASASVRCVMLPHQLQGHTVCTDFTASVNQHGVAYTSANEIDMTALV